MFILEKQIIIWCKSVASDAREENKGEESTPNPKAPCWPWCLSHALQHTPLLQVWYRILCTKSWPTAAASLQMGMSHLGPKLLSIPLVSDASCADFSTLSTASRCYQVQKTQRETFSGFTPMSLVPNTVRLSGSLEEDQRYQKWT